MSEDRGSDELRRSSSISWYSTYQSQLVGEPRTPWAQEPQVSNTMTSDEGDDELTSGNTIDGRQNFASKDKTKDSSRDGGSHGLSEQNAPRGLLRNGRSADDELEQNDDSPESRNDRQIFRPFSMIEYRQRSESKPAGGGGGDDDDAGEQKIQRSVSAFDWNEFYEEYKPPKRYQKPTNKINPRLSRTFVTGAGNDKCTNCGDRLYEMEKIHINHFSYHRSCFRCSQCQRLLNIGTFTSIDGQLFCKSHNLSVVNVMPGNQPSNGQRDSAPATEPNSYNGEDASTEVTLARISNMKSIFEVPLKVDDGAKKNAMHQRPEKMNQTIRQDFSFETRIHSEPPKVNQRDDVEITKETRSQIFHPSENRMEFQGTVYTPLANGAYETKTATAVVRPTYRAEKDEDDDDDDATDFRVSEAFAKFMSIERQNETGITPPKKSTRVQKPTGRSKQEPTTRVLITPQGDAVSFFATPERKTVGPPAVGYKATAGYFHPMPKAEGKVNSRYDSKQYASNDIRLENGYAINTEIPDAEIQITGITKRLRHHWESKDVRDGRRHQRHPTQGHGHGHGHGQGRGTGMNSAARRAKTYAPKTDVHVIRKGFDAKTRGYGPIYRSETSLRQHAPGRRIPGRVQEHDDAGSTWVGPLDFTQNQLAKFKQLEAMAARATRQSHLTKKNFRWGVKEVRPLHRPTSSYLHNDQNDSTPDIFMTTTTTTTSSPHRLLPTIQEHQRKDVPGGPIPPTLLSLSPDRHGHGQTTSSAVTLSTSRDTIDSQDASLTSVRETLAQFRSLEDLSRPSPNPVLALSQQKAAMATAPKPYHDVIHSAYNVQVATKE